MDLIAWVSFESPGYLVLLAVIPLLLALSYRSLAGLGRVRRALAIAFRCLVVCVMVLALAGAQRTQTIDDLSVMFLIDRSKSVPADLQREAFRCLTRAESGREEDDQIGVIAFDGAADVEQLPDTTLAISGLSAPSDPDQTDLAGATRMALALLPSDTMGRIVIASDGNENVGDILQEADRAGAAGVPIDVLPIQYEHANEVIFESLKTPPNATMEETINLQMVLWASEPTRGKILLWQNDKLVDLNGPEPATGQSVELQAGPNRHVIPVPLRQEGAHRFRARFDADQDGADTIDDNNTGRAFTVVGKQGKMLILTTREDLKSDQPCAEILQRALQAEGLDCDLEVAGETPLDQVELLNYSLVILSDVPAGDVGDEGKHALATFVRDLGGGLIMVGGADSFGAGGWLGSPVEEIMPVSFDVKHKKQFLRGALTLVMHASEAPRGNYLGERCAIEAVKTLSRYDLVGVLAYRWTAEEGHWTVPLQEVGNRTRIINAIRKMDMGDLPDLDELMRPGVEAMIARKDLQGGPKHMIVISDFDPQQPREDLIEMMQKNGVTCSTVAIYGGHQVDERKARWISDSTGGTFYRTNDQRRLPQIFIKEAREIRRSLVQEFEFTPQLLNPFSPVVSGLTSGGLPDLGGYVLTTRRPLADVPIVRKSDDAEDPILAHWQVGLGKTVAFTSGMWPRWGGQWTEWVKFSKFWAQIARWAARQSDEAAFDVMTTLHGGVAKLRIDAVDKNASAINFMRVRGGLVRPGAETMPLRLQQTGPGRYEAEFEARDLGDYIVNLRYDIGRGEQAASGSLRTGLSVAYSPEYSQLRPNLPLLEEVRARASGRALQAGDTKTVFDRTGLPTAEARHTMWENLIQWMLVLFLLDVAIRRIAINPAALYRKARAFLGEMAGRGRPASEAAAVLSTLKGTRERVRDERLAAGADTAEPKPRPDARYEAAASDAKASEELGRALGGATQQDAPVVARPTGKKPPQSEGEYTSRLLRAKRRARDEMDKEES